MKSPCFSAAHAITTVTDEAMSTARQEANGRITTVLKDVNKQLDEIGDLNAQIVAGTNVRQDVGDLQDRRDELIRSVATQMPVTVIPEENGSVTLMLSGARTLVGSDAQVHHLIAGMDSSRVSVGSGSAWAAAAGRSNPPSASAARSRWRFIMGVLNARVGERMMGMINGEGWSGETGGES